MGKPRIATVSSLKFLFYEYPLGRDGARDGWRARARNDDDDDDAPEGHCTPSLASRAKRQSGPRRTFPFLRRIISVRARARARVQSQTRASNNPAFDDDARRTAPTLELFSTLLHVFSALCIPPSGGNFCNVRAGQKDDERGGEGGGNGLAR